MGEAPDHLRIPVGLNDGSQYANWGPPWVNSFCPCPSTEGAERAILTDEELR